MRGIVSSAGGNSINVENIFYFRRLTTVNVLSETVLETAFQNNLALTILAALNLRYTQTLNAVRFINDQTRPFVFVNRAIAGTITGDSMPSNTAVYMLSRTAYRGKSFKGGKHFSPLSESDTTTATADILNAAALVRFQAIEAAWFAGWTDGNGNVWRPCVLSKKNSNFQVQPSVVSTSDITQCVTNQRLAKMKKHTIASIY
jgi:hypothetical protein